MCTMYINNIYYDNTCTWILSRADRIKETYRIYVNEVNTVKIKLWNFEMLMKYVTVIEMFFLMKTDSQFIGRVLLDMISDLKIMSCLPIEDTWLISRSSILVGERLPNIQLAWKFQTLMFNLGMRMDVRLGLHSSLDSEYESVSVLWVWPTRSMVVTRSWAIIFVLIWAAMILKINIKFNMLRDFNNRIWAHN